MERPIIHSKVIFKNDLKDLVLDPSSSFLIYDCDLLKHSPQFKSWQKKFRFQYSVKAGEDLKDLKYFESHLKSILKISKGLDTRRMSFVIIGGGSVGDFGGFVSSIFKRGVALIHVPSTWLAAIDSSHGGKTALNIDKAKNQIGSFYSAEKIYIVKQLLKTQAEARAHEAFGELIKIALIDGGTWIKNLASNYASDKALTGNLKSAIQAKYKIVKKDPFEKSGTRQLLNLGHTWGHVLESSLGLPHGTAVSMGLYFSVEWSLRRGLLTPREYLHIQSFLECLETEKVPKLNSQRVYDLLLQDKKSEGKANLSFIFLKGIGKPIRLRVSVQEVLNEAKRQGWLNL